LRADLNRRPELTVLTAAEWWDCALLSVVFLPTVYATADREYSRAAGRKNCFLIRTFCSHKASTPRGSEAKNQPRPLLTRILRPSRPHQAHRFSTRFGRFSEEASRPTFSGPCALQCSVLLPHLLPRWVTRVLLSCAPTAHVAWRQSHADCSEGFYGRELVANIRTAPLKSAAERTQMLALLNRFNQEDRSTMPPRSCGLPLSRRSWRAQTAQRLPPPHAQTCSMSSPTYMLCSHALPRPRLLRPWRRRLPPERCLRKTAVTRKLAFYAVHAARVPAPVCGQC
jgi:hypothetical protein